MVKIGLICWKQGGGTNDYIEPKKQPWLKDVKIVQKGKYKGLIPFEKALQAALLYKYKDKGIPFTISNNITSDFNIDVSIINKKKYISMVENFLNNLSIQLLSILLVIFIIIFIILMLNII